MSSAYDLAMHNSDAVFMISFNCILLNQRLYKFKAHTQYIFFIDLISE